MNNSVLKANISLKYFKFMWKIKSSILERVWRSLVNWAFRMTDCIVAIKRLLEGVEKDYNRIGISNSIWVRHFKSLDSVILIRGIVFKCFFQCSNERRFLIHYTIRSKNLYKKKKKVLGCPRICMAMFKYVWNWS